MKADWSIVSGAEFEAKLVGFRENISADLESCSQQVKGASSRAEAALDKLDRLEAFREELNKLNKGLIDILSLPVARDNTGEVIPNVLVLEKARWRAFFKMDFTSRTATAIFVEERTNRASSWTKIFISRFKKKP